MAHHVQWAFCKGPSGCRSVFKLLATGPLRLPLTVLLVPWSTCALQQVLMMCCRQTADCGDFVPTLMLIGNHVLHMLLAVASWTFALLLCPKVVCPGGCSIQRKASSAAAAGN